MANIKLSCRNLETSRHLGVVALWLLISLTSLAGVSSSEKTDANKIFTAEIPQDKQQEISILIGEKAANDQKLIGIQADGDSGSSNGTDDAPTVESTTLDKCGFGSGSKCCYQYTWPGYTDKIPERENATCEYLRKQKKDETLACFDPMVFTKPRGEAILSLPPDLDDLHRKAETNSWNIVCPMSTKTCVTYSYYNDQKKLANQTKFCGMVTDNSDKQLKKGCYRQTVGGMVREVCVCENNLCNSASSQFTSVISKLSLLTIIWTASCILFPHS